MFPFPLHCPLFFFTGIHCPTCGLGRGLMAALTGQWGLSWAYHPFAIPLLLFVTATIVGFCLSPIRVNVLFRKGRSLLSSHPHLVTFVLILYSAWGFGRWLDV